MESAAGEAVKKFLQDQQYYIDAVVNSALVGDQLYMMKLGSWKNSSRWWDVVNSQFAVSNWFETLDKKGESNKQLDKEGPQLLSLCCGAMQTDHLLVDH